MNINKSHKHFSDPRAFQNSIKLLRRSLIRLGLAYCFLLSMISAVSASGPNFNDTDNKPVSSVSPSFSGTVTLPGGTWATNGNVGIGSSTPQAKLDVEGAVYFGSGNVGIGTSAARALLDVEGAVYIQGNVGIGTTNPNAPMHVENGAFLASGTVGATPVSGAGTRMMWIPEKFAFRSGSVAGNEWNNANVGSGSMAIGYSTTASGYGAVAFGYYATASGYLSFSGVGEEPAASGWGSMALGHYASASASHSYAIGKYTQASASNAFTFGIGAAQLQTLNNNISYSMMIGFNSTIPTLFIGSSAGAGTTGNVGIGTSTPVAKLEVDGNVYVTGGNVGIGTWLPAVAGLQVGTGTSDLNATLGATATLIKGNLEVDGKIYGDGSGLTNLSASSQWSGTAGSAIYYNLANVGIGSTTPQAKIDVEGDVYFGSGNVGIGVPSTGAKLQVRNVNGGSSILYLENSATSDVSVFYDWGGSLNYFYGDTETIVEYTTGTITTGNMVRALQNTSAFSGTGLLMNFANGSGTFTGKFIDLQKNSLSQFVVMDTGNVGIGSATPQAKLDVEGTVYFGSGNVGIGTASPVGLLDVNRTLTVLSGGNVGISSVSPRGRLDIVSTVGFSTSNTASGQDELFLNGPYTSGIGPSIGFACSSGNYRNAVIAAVETNGAQYHYGFAFLGKLNLSDNFVTEMMRIGEGGVSIGTTDLSGKLQVSAGGRTFFISNTNANVGIGSTAPQQTLDVEGAVYFGTGNVGIGTAAPRQLLDVDGAVYMKGNVGIGSTAPQMLLEVKNGSILGTEYPVTTAAAMTINWADGNQQYVSLNQAGHTINFSNYKVGQILRLIVCQNGASRTVTTWDSSIVWASGSAPTLTATSGQCDIISFVCTNAKGSVKNFGAITSNF